MPNSITEICNAALTRIGVDRITDFDADPGIVAQRCRDNYAIVRDAVMRGYAWNCLLRRASLAANATAPAWGYARAFDLPAAPLYCLRVLEIANERDFGVKYKIEGRQILTDQADPLPVLYVARVTDVASYDALLADAIAQRLAAVLAYDRTGSRTVSFDKWQVYTGMLREARSVDAQEGSAEAFGPDPNEPVPGWLESRR